MSRFHDLCDDVAGMQRGSPPITFRGSSRSGRCDHSYFLPRPIPIVNEAFCSLLEQQAIMHEQMAEHCRETARLILNSDDFR